MSGEYIPLKAAGGRKRDEDPKRPSHTSFTAFAPG
jgi:hypothetical protein